MNEPQQPPRTIGELRRALTELGNPWTVTPRCPFHARTESAGLACRLEEA